MSLNALPVVRAARRDLRIELARGNRFCRRDEIRWEESRTIVLGWMIVAIVCALASIGGYAISRLVGARFMGALDGFAAGAPLVMLVGSMIPEAKEKAPIGAGFAAVIGHAVAAELSAIS